MKNLSGVVVSQKNPKTVTVNVVYYKPHKKYKKIVKTNKKIQAHYENFELSTGDAVIIKPSRPLSATKRFLVVDVKVKAKK
ncbi:MAG: 30S ribosomal protein S17 [Mycoplasmataceae bacterium]|nr:MAG: 30S ribosomal protein S17 [Mycoplasmataceae bacterium]